MPIKKKKILLFKSISYENSDAVKFPSLAVLGRKNWPMYGSISVLQNVWCQLYYLCWRQQAKCCFSLFFAGRTI